MWQYKGWITVLNNFEIKEKFRPGNLETSFNSYMWRNTFRKVKWIVMFVRLLSGIVVFRMT